MSDVVRQSTAASELTLPELLKRVAYAEVPARFYAVLQVCVPFAVQFWAWGWHRTAGWLGIASVFGVWALAQQRVIGYSDDGATQPPASSGRRLWRFIRGAAAAVGTIGTVILVLEVFAQIMAGVFKCPGCAG
jgi:hypothetical protein